MMQLARNTAMVEDLHRREQLLAMRHLRPGTALLRPRGILERQLFDSLLHLPDGDDPLRWLREEGRQLTALLMLSLIFDYVAQLQQSSQHLARQHEEYGTSSEHELLAEVYPQLLVQQRMLFGESLMSAGEW